MSDLFPGAGVPLASGKPDGPVDAVPHGLPACIPTRYRVLSYLGEGAFGVVYRAVDTDSGHEVALKVHKTTSPLEAALIKEEFRTIVGIRHPCLVRLLELVSVDEGLCLVMDYVPGVALRDHPLQSEAAVQDVVRQLAAAVDALHAAGVVHGDLKPDNVLVRPDGNVTLLDFGFSRTSGPGGSTAANTRGGTLTYMSPALLFGAMHTAQDDAFALGATILEWVEGRLPYDVEDVMRQRTQRPPQRHALLGNASLALLREMVSAVPEARPSVRALLDSLSGSTVGVGRVPLVGRDDELEAVRRFAVDCRPNSILVVTGPSGIGKSSLVTAGLSAAAESGVTWLRNRCHPGIPVPHVAFDALGDMLAHQTPDAVWGSPTERSLAARLFPVLGLQRAGTNDPGRDRSEAQTALAAILAAGLTHGPFVVWIDDAQWADADSWRLFRALRQSDARLPPIVISTRAALDREEPTHGILPSDVLRIDLAPMSEDSALALVRLAVPDIDLDEAKRWAAGGGVPFDILMALRGREGLIPDGAQVPALPESLHALVRALAIAGRPVPIEDVVQVAGWTRVPTESEWTLLEWERLVQRHSRADTWHADSFHDRVRDAAISHLRDSGGLRDVHLRWAERLIARDQNPRPDQIAHHLDSAGDERARSWLMRAGDAAIEGLAFEMAVAHFRGAARYPHVDRSDAARLSLSMARALDYSGRNAEAAEAYMLCIPAEDPASGASSALRRRACELWLGAAHLEQGRALLPQVLDDVGMRLPRASRLGIVVRTLFRKMSVRPVLAPPEAKQTALIDACWMGSATFSMIDPLLGGYFQAHGLALASRQGTPAQLARLQGIEAAYRSMTGVDDPTKTDLFLRCAMENALSSGEPHAWAIAEGSIGLVAHMRGDFQDCLDRCNRALRIYREQCRGARWDINTAELFAMSSLIHLGRWEEAARRADANAEAAGELNDRMMAAFSTASFRCHGLLAKDSPEQALTEIHEGMHAWPPEPYLVPHFWYRWGTAMVHLYMGRAAEASREFYGSGWRFWTSALSSIYMLRAEWLCVAGRLLLASVHGPLPWTTRAKLWMINRVLRTHRGKWPAAHGWALWALAEWRAGKLERARQSFARAHAGYLDAGSSADALAVDVRLAELDERGTAGALEALRQTGIRNPEAWVAATLPNPMDDRRTA